MAETYDTEQIRRAGGHRAGGPAPPNEETRRKWQQIFEQKNRSSIPQLLPPFNMMQAAPPPPPINQMFRDEVVSPTEHQPFESRRGSSDPGMVGPIYLGPAASDAQIYAENQSMGFPRERGLEPLPRSRLTLPMSQSREAGAANAKTVFEGPHYADPGNAYLNWFHSAGPGQPGFGGFAQDPGEHYRRGMNITPPMLQRLFSGGY